MINGTTLLKSFSSHFSEKYDETITWEKVLMMNIFCLQSFPRTALFSAHTNDTLLVDQLEYLAEYLDFLTNPMIMHSESSMRNLLKRSLNHLE